MAGKYALREKFLRVLPADQREVTLGFEQIERIVKDKLPSSAYEHRQWWEHKKEGNTSMGAPGRMPAGKWRGSISRGNRQDWLELNKSQKVYDGMYK